LPHRLLCVASLDEAQYTKIFAFLIVLLSLKINKIRPRDGGNKKIATAARQWRFSVFGIIF